MAALACLCNWQGCRILLWVESYLQRWSVVYARFVAVWAAGRLLGGMHAWLMPNAPGTSAAGRHAFVARAEYATGGSLCARIPLPACLSG